MTKPPLHSFWIDTLPPPVPESVLAATSNGARFRRIIQVSKHMDGIVFFDVVRVVGTWQYVSDSGKWVEASRRSSMAYARMFGKRFKPLGQ